MIYSLFIKLFKIEIELRSVSLTIIYLIFTFINKIFLNLYYQLIVIDNYYYDCVPRI